MGSSLREGMARPGGRRRPREVDLVNLRLSIRTIDPWACYLVLRGRAGPCATGVPARSLKQGKSSIGAGPRAYSSAG